MRSDAKASSVGSTADRAHTLGSSIRGAFAIRGASAGPSGSGAPSIGTAPAKLLLVLSLTVLAALTALASPALAVETRPYTGVSIGPKGPGPGVKFARIGGVAIDPATRNLYVLDQDARRIYKFDPAGAPANFSGLGSNYIANVPSGGSEGLSQLAIAPPGSPAGSAGNIYAASAGTAPQSPGVSIYSAAGAKLGNFGPINSCGVSTDSAGNLYVGDDAQGKILKYSPASNPSKPTLVGESQAPLGKGVCNTAVDGAGRVYFVDRTAEGGEEKGVFKLESLEAPTATAIESSEAGNQSGEVASVGVGINPANDNVLTMPSIFEKAEVAEYDSVGNLLLTFGQERLRSGTYALAVDPVNNQVYVGDSYFASGGTPTARVFVFGPPALLPSASTEAASSVGKQTATLNGTVSADGAGPATCVFRYASAADFASSEFLAAAQAPCDPGGPFTGSASEAVSADLSGLTANTTYKFQVLASNANGSNEGGVMEFSTNQALGVETLSASAISDSNATLNGTVNPEGTELEECRFEYGLSESYGSSVPCAETPAAIGAGNDPVPVHADLSGLNGGSGYHFRLAAENEFGISNGADATFKTLGPTIQSTSVTGVSDTGATFKATINPNGVEASYVFEYVSEADFAVSGYANATKVPATAAAIGAGESGVEVEQQVSGLSSRTTYHLRAIATSADGQSRSRDLILTTFPAASGTPGGLPDGRAYEQATPIDKNGGNAQGHAGSVRTSPAGDGITFFNTAGLPGIEGAQGFSTSLALRGLGDWSFQGLLPPARLGTYGAVSGLSTDLRVSYAVAGTPGGEVGLYEKDTATGETSLIHASLSGQPSIQGARHTANSADNSKALFENEKPLRPGAPAAGFPAVYLWDRDAQELVLVSVLNDGQSPFSGANAGAYSWFNPTDAGGGGGPGPDYYTQEQNVLAADGARVFFTSLNDRQLYMRVNPLEPQSAMSGGECTEAARACTVKISESQRLTPDPNLEPAKFAYATPSGSKVFFMSNAELTDDANTGAANDSADLYSYDTASGELTDLAASSSAENPQGAEVAGVMGISDDGEDVYFEAGGVLAPGASHGECPQEYGDADASSACNLYRWHEGEVSFIARIAGNAQANIAPGPGTGMNRRTARVSPDGEVAIFMSTANLTGYDADGRAQLYRYEAEADGVACISCLPSGELPSGEASLASIRTKPIAPPPPNIFNTRNLARNGNRIFFESPDRLVASDGNGVKDVYEWESAGTGSCTASEENGGCLYLISSGTSPTPSYLADTSASGDDAYFFTAQPLVGQDQDQLVDIYDARVGGGLAAQNPPPPNPCAGQACRGQSAAPPVTPTSGTSNFSGPGNPKPKKGKPHKKKHGKKHRKKQHKKSQTKKQRAEHRQGSGR